MDPTKRVAEFEFSGPSSPRRKEDGWDIYRLLVENSYDLVAELDINGDFAYVNPSYSAALGYTEKEVLQKNAFSFVHTQDQEKARREFQQQDGTTVLRFRHLNGAWKWFDCSFRQFTTKEGFRTVLISRDISARKEAEIKFEILASLGSKLSSTKTQVEAARVIAEAAQVLCGWDAFSLDLYDFRDDLIRPVLMVDEIDGKKTEIIPEYETRSPSPFVRTVLQTGPQRTLRKGNDFEAGLRAFGDKTRASASLLFVPIVEEGQPLGIVSIQSYRINAYSRSDLKLLQVLAGHCSGTLARIRAVDGLRESQARFEAFMENTPAAAWIKDEYGRYIFANQWIEELLNKPAKEVLAKTDAEILAPELARQLQQEDTQVRQGGKPIRSEKAVLPGESHRWFICKFPFLSSKGGSFVGGLAFDITDQVQMQRSLQASEEKFQTLFESSPVAIGLLKEGRLLYTNSSYRRMFNAGPETDISGRNFLDDFSTSTREELQEYLENNDSSAASFPPTERRGLRKGAEFPCIIQIAPVELADGTAHLAFIVDISEKRALESQLFQAQKMESIGRLAGGIAHDFANLLTIIQGHATRIERGMKNPAPSLDSIVRAAQKATELTKQLLAFSRKQTLQIVDTDLNDAVTQITRMIERVIGEDITLRLHLSPMISIIKADRSLIEQLIINLAVTARDSMIKGGHLTISTFFLHPGERARFTAGLEYGAVCLRIEDTGRGIPREDLPQIFEPFFKTSIGTESSLRLATVYGIVKQHSGNIDIQSQIGQGTTFEIYFPATALPAKPQHPLFVPRKTASSILVVEDSADLRGLIRDLLSDEGYEVFEAPSCAAGLEFFQASMDRIGLVLADVCLEDGSGRELVRRLRSLKPSIKTILTTGYDPHQIRSEMDLQPNEHFLPKPFQLEELLQLIENLLASEG